VVISADRSCSASVSSGCASSRHGGARQRLQLERKIGSFPPYERKQRTTDRVNDEIAPANPIGREKPEK